MGDKSMQLLVPAPGAAPDKATAVPVPPPSK
jgi:hypothetical protein